MSNDIYIAIDAQLTTIKSDEETDKKEAGRSSWGSYCLSKKRSSTIEVLDWIQGGFIILGLFDGLL